MNNTVIDDTSKERLSLEVETKTTKSVPAVAPDDEWSSNPRGSMAIALYVVVGAILSLLILGFFLFNTL